MANFTVTKGLLGKQDLKWNAGTFSRLTSTGGSQTLNGFDVLDATMFAGADIGAKINAALASFPANTTGEIYIPAGTYSFSTTIQLPIASYYTRFKIRGAGNGRIGGAADQGATILKYTGTGTAIDQTITNATYQNAPGFVLEDFLLDGGGAGASAIGVQFGGILMPVFHNITVQRFNGASAVGIKVKNSSGIFTERIQATNLFLEDNKTSLYFNNSPTGGQNSFAHQNMQIFINTVSGQTGILLDGGGYLINSNLVINGNIGNGTVGIAVTGSSVFQQNNVIWTPEQYLAGGATRFSVAAGSTFEAKGFLENYTFTDVKTGTFNLQGWDGLYTRLGNATATNPTDTTATIFNQSGIGPTISGLTFQVRTGAVTPIAALDIDTSGNGTFAGNVLGDNLAAAAFLPQGNYANPGGSGAAFYNQSGVGPTISGNAIQFRTGAVPAAVLNISIAGTGTPGTTGQSWGSSTLQWRVHNEVLATASLPAAGASMDGAIILEDAGAGDRNVVIYAGGQRFRIDGGAAF